MPEIDIFKALSDPTRLKILECIKDKEKCICEVIPYTSKSQPNVSTHIKVLKNAGLIIEQKKGTNIIIRAPNKNIFEIIEMARRM